MDCHMILFWSGLCLPPPTITRQQLPVPSKEASLLPTDCVSLALCGTPCPCLSTSAHLCLTRALCPGLFLFFFTSWPCAANPCTRLWAPTELCFSVLPWTTKANNRYAISLPPPLELVQDGEQVPSYRDRQMNSQMLIKGHVALLCNGSHTSSGPWKINRCIRILSFYLSIRTEHSQDHGNTTNFELVITRFKPYHLIRNDL